MRKTKHEDERRPWFAFYPSDWRADQKLRLCSAATRGVWIDLLGLMHEATPRGHLTVGGRAASLDEIALLIATPPETVATAVAELLDRGVCDRRKNGVLVSRRMVRDEKRARNARANGKIGGNPALTKKPGNSDGSGGWDNPGVKPGVKPQRPEARGQSPEDSPNGECRTRGRKARDLDGLKARTPRARKLARNWKPSAADRAWATDRLGFTETTLDVQTAEFVNYWTGRGDARDGWSEVWRASMERLHRRTPRLVHDSAASDPARPPASAHESNAARLRRLAAG